MTPQELVKLLESVGVPRPKISGNNVVACCPFHTETRPSWGISLEAPYFYNCFGCGAKGTLRHLLLHAGFDPADAKIVSGDFNVKGKRLPSLQTLRDLEVWVDEEEITPSQRENMLSIYPLALEHPTSRAYLIAKRKLTVETVYAAGLRYHEKHNRILFPWWVFPGEGKEELVAVTGRAVNPAEKEKIVSYFEGKKLSHVYHAIEDFSGKLLAITEGEISGLAFRQMTGIPTIALGRGNVSETQLEYVRKLPYERLLIATDWDKVGNSLRHVLYMSFKSSHIVQDVVFTGEDDRVKDPADVLKFSSAKNLHFQIYVPRR